MQHNPIVSRDEWTAASRALLLREKQATHLREEVNAARLAMPWVKVDKDYPFETSAGKRCLADLFAGRSQLIVYHFMFAPGWTAGCPNCSFVADHFDGALAHLEHHDVTFTAVSRAPLAEIKNYQQRMGWRFPWVSSFGNDFNRDLHVSFTAEELAQKTVQYNHNSMDAADVNDEMPGLSAFIKDDTGDIFHTYSSYARGLEELIGTLMILDRAPRGRNEATTMDFVRRHDEYETTATP